MLGASKSIWGFNPVSAIPGCTLWLDGSDSNTMFQNTAGTTPVTGGGQSVQLWRDKSVSSNHVTGTGTWSGSNMVFNGSTNAFSNLTYVFPHTAYSLFAVYSNTVAPAAAAYMNVMYGSNGFPMLGTFGSNRDATARSVVANTGALTSAVPLGWAARIGGTGDDSGNGIATDLSGNVVVTGQYIGALTVYNQGAAGAGVVTLPAIGSSDIFIAKYSSIGDVLWAARIGGTGVGDDGGTGIATDSSGNVVITGYYSSALTVYNQGAAGTGAVTLPFTGNQDVFVAKYSSIGDVQWAARISGTAFDNGTGIATDPSGNVFVTGFYGGALTVYNQGGSGTGFVTLPFVGIGSDVFVAKYNSVGAVQWAARIGGTASDDGKGIATDSSGNVVITGYYSSALTVYNQGAAGAGVVTLPLIGGRDCFIAKYNSIGDVQWAARIAGTDFDIGTGIATDPSGNVFITGYYGGALTVYNQGAAGAGVVTLPLIGGQDVFIAKYNSIGDVQWAARIGGVFGDLGFGIATDPSGNVFVTGQYSTALTVYNQGPSGAGVVTLPFTGGIDAFIAKYNSIGDVQWAARITGAGSSQDIGYGIATDPSGNVFVTGQYSTALTVYNQGEAGTAAITMPSPSGREVFVAKYNPDGYITNFPVPANSNVLVDATYLPSTMSPFINGSPTTSNLAGTTLATTGVFIGGPSNRYNGTLSELLIYNNTLTVAQRQAVEGYLAYKWRLQSKFPIRQPYYIIPPFSRYFAPVDIPGCTLWMDGGDNSTMNSTTAVTIWRDKSGSGNNMSGSGTWSGSNMVFNGSTNAFSNLTYVFPFRAYSLFAVYSNTVAPAAAAYMNVMYGSNGFPMLGTFDVGRSVTARSVVANTGALLSTAPLGWAARIASTTTSFDRGNAIATDPSGNVLVTGNYGAAVTIYNQGAAGTASLILPYTGGTDVFVAKYTPTGAVSWAARIAGTTTGADSGNAIATDPSGNVLVAGYYSSAVTIYNQGSNGTGAVTLPFISGQHCFIAKYLPNGAVSWAARIASSAFDEGLGIATDLSGNVLVTGRYGAALTIYNQGSNGTSGATLPFIGGSDVFVAKYLPDGTVSWAARIAGTGIDQGLGIATDVSGNVLVTGFYGAAVTISNQGSNGTGVVTLPYIGGNDCFVAKYTSAGVVSWGARIAGITTSGDVGNAIAADPSGNVLVAGYYGNTVTIYNQGSNGTGAVTLPSIGGNDVFVAKYLPNGAVSWAARIAGTTTSGDIGYAIATDPSGNVLVTGSFVFGATVYNQGSNGTAAITLTSTSTQDCFVAKYTPAGAVVWAARMSSGGSDVARGIATDLLGNVFVTGDYGATLTVYNQGSNGTAAITLPYVANTDVFVVKYNPDGFIANIPVPANSNVLVDTTYLPSTMSPFINGIPTNTLAGTTLATTGIFLGGPSNYFNGSLSELLIYSSTLTSNQRQQVEGYLLQKWGLRSQIVSTQPYLTLPPSTTTPPGYSSVSSGDWIYDWQPYIQSLVRVNSAATATFSSTSITGTSPGSGAYTGGVLAPNGRIYCPPSEPGVNNNGAVIDPIANAFTRPLIGARANFGPAYLGGVLAPNGKIYCIPYAEPNVGVIDPDANTITTFGTAPGGTGAYAGGVLAPNGKIYCIPFWTTTVGVIDPNANTFTSPVTGTASTRAYYGGVLAPNGKIYCIPYFGTNVGVIDPDANTFTTFGTVPGDAKYAGGVLGPNGKIYCMPSLADNVGVIDPVANTFTTFGTALPGGSSRFVGGVLAPNGKIYCIPNSATYVGVISPSGMIEQPSLNYCLSPWVNKL